MEANTDTRTHTHTPTHLHTHAHTFIDTQLRDKNIIVSRHGVLYNLEQAAHCHTCTPHTEAHRHT